MRAMLLKQPKTALVFEDVPMPRCKEQEILIKVQACGVCRTDLHIREGDLPYHKLPLILGHEIVGTVEEVGKSVKQFQGGERVGAFWLAWSCGKCLYCKRGKENLCDNARYTGYDTPGGFAEYTVCHANYAIPLPSSAAPAHLAPFLCAGLIGYRAYLKADAEEHLGLYGFGAAAHILTQIAVYEGKKVYAFTREGDEKRQAFARELGAVWAGGSTTAPPLLLDADILFAPVGDLVPFALKALKKGGRCICAGIHMSDIPSFPYNALWGEKTLRSVANVTREDAYAFFSLLSKYPLDTHVKTYPLEKANEALDALKQGKFPGAVVLVL